MHTAILFEIGLSSMKKSCSSTITVLTVKSVTNERAVSLPGY